MSKIQMTKNWQPKPSESLVESLPVKEGKKILEEKHVKISLNKKDPFSDWLSWVFFDRNENTNSKSGFHL